MPRGVHPQRIRSWANTALELAQSNSTVDIAFVVSYSTWEALQARILAVALYRQGYAMSVAHEFLGNSELNDRHAIKAQFTTIIGRSPGQTPRFGSHWREVNEWSRYRNGLVHGLSTYNPETLRIGVTKIAGRLLDVSWLAKVPVPATLGGPLTDTVPLGDVLSRPTGGLRNGASAQSLARKVRSIRTA